MSRAGAMSRSLMVAVIGVVGLGFVGPTQSAIADEADAQYFEQLRTRGLFSLAEAVCRRRLNEESLLAHDRAQTAIELARTYAAHARSRAEGDERRDLWNAAHESLKRAREQAAELDLRLELAVQDTVVTCDQAEFDGLLSELNPFDQRQQLEVGKLRDRALRELEQLDGVLQEAISRPAGKPLVAARLKSLQKAVWFQTGELLVAQGRQLPRSSPERSAAWLHAEQKLKRVAGGTTDDRVTWLSQVALARLLRLKSDTDRAAVMLTAIERDDPPADIAEEVVAERVELLVSAKQLPDAAEVLRNFRQTRTQMPARLAYLFVRTWLDSARVAQANGERGRELASELVAEARRTIDREPNLAAGYWAHRARLLLDQFEEAQRLGESLAGLLREARGRYAGGETEAALAVFAQAFEEAAMQGNGAWSFEIGLTLARLQMEQRQIDQAVSLLERMLKLHAQHARVAELDLLHAICLGRRFQATPTKPLREAYEAALARHVDQFEGSPTAADAAWMVAQLKEKQTQFDDALAFYARIPPEHARADEARAAVARCYRKLVEAARRDPKFDGDLERQALSKLLPMADRVAQQDEPLSGAQADFLQHVAFIAVSTRESPPSTARWIQRLNQFVEAPTDDEVRTRQVAELQRPVLSLSVMLLARSPSAAELERQAAQVQAVPIGARLQLLKSVESSLKHLGMAERRAVASITVLSLEHAVLETPQPPGPIQVEIERLLASSYETLGDAASAKAALRRLEKVQP